uniref:Metallo-beta-lactamase domain-containing protein n=1 Tax=Corethron hystrix TaxID=216773 RepID=A0A7S1B339_9STRA
MTNLSAGDSEGKNSFLEPLHKTLGISPEEDEVLSGCFHIFPYDSNSPIDHSSYLLPLRRFKSFNEADAKLPMNPPPYIMVDVPKYSPDLASLIRKQCLPRGKKGRPKKSSGPTAMIITNRNSVHGSGVYDEQEAFRTGIFDTESDVFAWRREFPSMVIAMHRHDVRSDTRGALWEIVDGYGPWSFDAGAGGMRTLERGEDIPAEGASVIYVPGHTPGSVCVLMPHLGVVVSGNLVPDDPPMRLDAWGFVTTNSAGIVRQANSIRKVAKMCGANAKYMLPSRGGARKMGGNEMMILADTFSSFAPDEK